jgi:hypothetical protein
MNINGLRSMPEKRGATMPADTLQKNLGIDPDVLVKIYRQMSRIHEVDKAIRSGLSAGRMQFTY